MKGVKIMLLDKAFIPPQYQGSIGFVSGVPFYQNEYEFLLERLLADYLKVKEWAEAEMMPYMTRKSINERHSSYALKHAAERELGFYVSNADIKLILLDLGVPFKAYRNSPNVTYPLSQHFFRRRNRCG